MSKNYKITLLPGDGIGPEIMKVAVAVLQAIAPKFDLTFAFETALIGGAAIDATGHPLPDETLQLCKNSDAVLLAAVGGDKWDSMPSHTTRTSIIRITWWDGTICKFTSCPDFAPIN